MKKKETINKEKIVKKEKTRDRIVNNFLLVAVLILLFYILIATGSIKLTTVSNKINPNKVEEVDSEEKTKLKVTDSTVTSLYKSVELGRSYNALRHYYFYSYDNVFAKYMDDAFIKEMALSKLTFQDATSIDATILEEKFISLVGNNAVYKNRTFQTQCATVKYISSTNSYNVVKNNGCDTTNPDNYQYFDKITSAYKYSDRIEITTRVGYAISEKELVSEGIYQETGKIIIKKDMDIDSEIGMFTESLDQIKKTIDYNKLTKYKYTFRLDNTKYYFYSVEKIED